MNNLTEVSKQRLSTCDHKLQLLVEEINRQMHINVSIGHRDQVKQDEAFYEGKSQLKYPKSKHNMSPSLAVDIYPIANNQIAWEKFDELGVLIKETAKRLNIPITWGGDWKMRDKPHIELK